MEKGVNKKILLIKLSSLGDVIFNIPLANALKNAGYSVSWLVSEKGYAVLKDNPCVDEVIIAPFEKWKKQNLFRNIKEFIEIRKYLSKKNFDIIIDTQGRWKSLVFTMFSNSKKRLIGTDSKEFSSLGCNEKVNVPPKGDWSLNVVEKYLLYAKHIGIENPQIHMSLPYSKEEEIAGVNILLSSIDNTKPLLVLCPVTTWTTKHWNKDNWKKVVDSLSEKFNIVFTGTKNDNDYIEYINQNRFLNLAGKTNLKELIALFRKSDLIISLDSGSTHLAMASNAKRIISIYCSTPKSYYAPIGDNYVGLCGNLDCQPCHKRKCKFRHDKQNLCTKLPAPEEVIQTVKEFNLF